MNSKMFLYSDKMANERLTHKLISLSRWVCTLEFDVWSVGWEVGTLQRRSAPFCYNITVVVVILFCILSITIMLWFLILM